MLTACSATVTSQAMWFPMVDVEMKVTEKNLAVMGTTDRTYTMVGLMASTQYVVMVAAINSDGVTGPFSNPVFVQTLGKTIGIYIATVDFLCANYTYYEAKSVFK